MIQAPNTKSLSREEFPKQADWIDPLLRAINGIADGLASAVASLNSQTATAYLDIDFPATYTAAFPKVIANPLNVKATHVWATAVSLRTDPSSTVLGMRADPTTNDRGLFVEWENSTTGDGARQLKIKMVTGLDVLNKYRITLRIEA